MTECVTYYSANAVADQAWLAFVILPNGTYWQVRFNGRTEEEAKKNAVEFYLKEKQRVAADVPNPWASIPAPQGRGAHFAGKIWLIHITTREKIRVEPNDPRANSAEWERGGPRSK